jgi:hypothetical protein
MKLKNLFAPDTNPGSSLAEDTEFCCGKHAICKKNRPPHSSQNSVEYYDDEELDAFKGRRADTYTAKETEQFMEIFRTLWKSDILGWRTSLCLRGIELPLPLQSIKE